LIENGSGTMLGVSRNAAADSESAKPRETSTIATGSDTFSSWLSLIADRHEYEVICQRMPFCEGLFVIGTIYPSGRTDDDHPWKTLCQSLPERMIDQINHTPKNSEPANPGSPHTDRPAT
jgi:hypothetical protein